MDPKDEMEIDPTDVEIAVQILQDATNNASIDTRNAPQWCRGCRDFDVVDGACVCDKRNMLAALVWEQCESESAHAGIS